MRKSPLRLGMAVILGSSLGAPAAFASSVVHVLLQDPSTGNGVTKMQIMRDPDHVTAGRITFEIRNDSKTLVHEMLLLREQHAGDTLPYNTKQQRVIEAKTVKLVDTDDIRPGRSVRKTVNLSPGSYEMICNEPGHYMQGMRTEFTVTH